MDFAAMETNLEHFSSTSYAGITLHARIMALSGHTAMEISRRLDMHMAGALAIVDECKAHREAFAAWLRRSA